MAQSREQEILAKATPRPWEKGITGFCTNDGAVTIMAADAELERVRIALVDRRTPAKRKDAWRVPDPVRDANQSLILLAVNSYEADQELIRKLTDAIGNFVCTSCDHPLRLHLDEYGCEQEGQDIAGNEGVPAHASGPCGCVGGSPAEDALIEALKAAREGAKHVG